MSELTAVKLLRGVLRTHLNWHGARLDCLARFILTLLQVRSVNLARLAPVLSSSARISSNHIRLQRFFRTFTVAQADVARLLEDGEWLLLASDSYAAHAVAEYAERWTIETLFAAMNRHTSDSFALY